MLARRLSIRGEQGRDHLPLLESSVFELRISDKIGKGGVGSLTPGEESVAVSRVFPSLALVLKSFLPPSFGDTSQAARKVSSISRPSKASSPFTEVDEFLSESMLFWRL